MCWTERGAHHPKARQDLLPRGFISHDPRGQCQKSAQIPSQTWRQRVPSSLCFAHRLRTAWVQDQEMSPCSTDPRSLGTVKKKPYFGCLD